MYLIFKNLDILNSHLFRQIESASGCFRRRNPLNLIFIVIPCRFCGAADAHLVLVTRRYHWRVPLYRQRRRCAAVQFQVPHFFWQGDDADGGGLTLGPLPVLGLTQGDEGNVVIASWWRKINLKMFEFFRAILLRKFYHTLCLSVFFSVSVSLSLCLYISLSLFHSLSLSLNPGRILYNILYIVTNFRYFYYK